MGIEEEHFPYFYPSQTQVQYEVSGNLLLLIDLKKVKEKETICKVLNQKGLISDKEYNFETNEVAVLYDETTFRGYLFILKPIIFPNI